MHSIASHVKPVCANRFTNVVVVDDDLDTLRLVERILLMDTELQTSINKFTNPQEAFDNCLANGVDVLLTDLDMPTWNGFKLLKELKKRNFLTQVVIVSAQPTTNAISSAFSLGADEYLTKPIDPLELRHTVRYLKDRISRLRSYLN